MKTILIPTDFSENSNNAARYGIELASHIQAEKIILYNAYSMPFVTEMTWALLETDDLKKSSEASLEKSKMSLLPFCNDTIAIETISDFGFVDQRIGDIAKQIKADLIIMGIGDGGKLEQMLFGSNTISVIHHTDVPVLIVPKMATWHKVDKIAWACDYNNLEKTAPIHAIQQVLQLTHAELHIIHNHTHDVKNFDKEIVREHAHLQQWFENTQHAFALLEGKDLSKSVNEYVFDKGIDWLIAIPKKHGWLKHLFTKSHTEDLVIHTHIPLLCLHQAE